MSDHSEFTLDYIWGSGFTSFPWYASADYDAWSDLLSVSIEDDGTVEGRARLTSAELWRAFRELLVENPRQFSAPSTLFGTYDEIDLDAGDADIIVQTAVLGEIVFG